MVGKNVVAHMESIELTNLYLINMFILLKIKYLYNKIKCRCKGLTFLSITYLKVN